MRPDAHIIVTDLTGTELGRVSADLDYGEIAVSANDRVMAASSADGFLYVLNGEGQLLYTFEQIPDVVDASHPAPWLSRTTAASPSTSARNSSSTALKVSGLSMLTVCPASGITAWRVRGSRSAMAAELF